MYPFMIAESSLQKSDVFEVSSSFYAKSEFPANANGRLNEELETGFGLLV